MDAISPYSTPCGPLCHNRITETEKIVRTRETRRSIFSVMSAMLSTLIVGMKTGALLYETYEWLHSIWLLW